MTQKKKKSRWTKANLIVFASISILTAYTLIWFYPELNKSSVPAMAKVNVVLAFILVANIFQQIKIKKTWLTIVLFTVAALFIIGSSLQVISDTPF